MTFSDNIFFTTNALSRAHVPPTKVFQRLISYVAAANTYTSDFPDVKFSVAALIRYLRKQSDSSIHTDRQTQMRANTFTSSFVRGNNYYQNYRKHINTATTNVTAEKITCDHISVLKDDVL